MRLCSSRWQGDPDACSIQIHTVSNCTVLVQFRPTCQYLSVNLTAFFVLRVHPVQISEHVFGLVLAFARDLAQSYSAQKEGRWHSFSHQDVFELADKTMLLIGVGAIGQRIARLAKAFDMHVIGMRRQADKTVPHVDQIYGPESLAELLPEADVKSFYRVYI